MFVHYVLLQGLTKMTSVIITIRVMPESPDVNLDRLQTNVLNEVKNFAGDTEFKKEIEPVAFGLKALKITFVCDENNSNLDELENNIRKIEDVNSVEVIDVRRAIG